MPQPPTVRTLSAAELPALLTVQEVAALLRLDPSTVYRAAASGELESVRLSAKLGSAIRIPVEELRRLLGAHYPEEA
jgi:excisionase family DNA binding protein